MKERTVYQLKVTLRGSRPPIWRRIQVRKDVTLHHLHQILQVAMGWTDSHLHQFRVGDTYYGTPDPEFGAEVKNERKIRVDAVLRRARARLVYEYDFGDGWEHDVVLEATVPETAERRYPLVLAGKRRCPPEDVGGIGGYAHFLQAIANPEHPDHRDMKEWWGDSFDPEAFDMKEVNGAIHGGRRQWRPDV